MVEVVLVLVKPGYGDGQEPAALLIILRVGVHHPLVAGLCDEHGTGLSQVVNIELHRVLRVSKVRVRANYECQPLVVKHAAGIYFKRLFHHLSGIEHDGHAVAAQWHAVHLQFGSIGVGSQVKEQVEHAQSSGGGLRVLTVVGDVHLEACRVAHGHAAYALLIQSDDGVLYLLRALVERGAGAVEHRLAPVLPRVACGTATCAIDEGAWIDGIRQVDSVSEMCDRTVHPVIEIVVAEDVELVFGCGRYGLRHHAIDIHVEMALGVHRQGEALLAAVTVGRSISGFGLILSNWCDAKLKLTTGKLKLCEVFAQFLLLTGLLFSINRPYFGVLAQSF